MSAPIAGTWQHDFALLTGATMGSQARPRFMSPADLTAARAELASIRVDRPEHCVTFLDHERRIGAIARAAVLRKQIARAEA